MKKLFTVWILALAAAVAQNPSNSNVVVVGNEAQPVQPTHKSTIQTAITRAGIGGMVVIPADYQFLNETFTNPNNILVIDLRKNRLALSGGVEVVSGNLLLDYGAVVSYFTNSGGGTTCNGLVKVDTSGPGFNGKLVATVGGEAANQVVGVVQSGCGTSGVVSVAVAGQIQLILDTATPTVGDFVGVASGPFQGTDVGTNPAVGTIGYVILTPAAQLPSGCTAAPGCYIQLSLGGSGGGGSNPNALVKNPGNSGTNNVQPTATGFPAVLQRCPGGAASTDLCADVQDNAGNHILQALQNGQVKLGAGATKSIATTTSSNTDLAGELTNSGGTSSYTFTGTYASHPICTAADFTNIAAVKVTYTGTTSVTFTTAGATDVIEYQCIGRN
jgi:hypothetical protein